MNGLQRHNRELTARVDTAKKTLAAKIRGEIPRTAVVLGSGLGAFTATLKNADAIPYGDIPHMPVSAVPGHAGRFVVGKTEKNISVIALEGRVHAYEGHDLSAVTFYVRLLARLGVKRLILTNAAGSVNPSYRPGDFVLIDDHINFSGHTPLTGIFDSGLGPRFVDMSRAYDGDLNSALVELAAKSRPRIRLHRGVYAGVAGPQYETPAEIRMLGKLGADVVGMSTVPETIVARQCGLMVNGISCVTNYGAGLSEAKLHHEEVAKAAAECADDFMALVNGMIGAAAVGS